MSSWSTTCASASAQFEMVTIAAEYPDQFDTVKDFLTKKHASMKNYILASDNKDELYDALEDAKSWKGELPFTLIVNEKGEVIYRERGELWFLKMRRAIVPELNRIKPWGGLSPVKPKMGHPDCQQKVIGLIQRLGLVSLVVADYDEALAFYVGKLGFTLVEDSFVPEQNKRWVVIEPPGATGRGAKLLLARGANPEQVSRIGNQTGGRVFLFLYTDDFWRDFNAYKALGIEFVREPSEAPYGTVAVFKDLYGTLWDLVQLR